MFLYYHTSKDKIRHNLLEKYSKDRIVRGKL